MTRRAVVAVLALTCLLPAAGCSGSEGGRSDAAPPPTTMGTVGPEPTMSAAGAVTPSVMIGDTIWTPGRQLDVAVSDPVAFVAVRGGFLVSDAAGVVHLVDAAGRTRAVAESGRGGARALLVSPAADRVAWAAPVPGGHRVTTYDVTSGRTTTRTVAGGDGTVLADLDGARLVVRDGRPRLAGGPAVSPGGDYAVSVRGGRVRVHRGDVTLVPDEVRGASHPVWLDEDTFSLELESAPLISPPDGRVFRVETCEVTGGCTAVITTVTGANLADPGVHVRAEAP